MRDQVLVQIRITSDDLDGHSLQELASLLIAVLKGLLIFLDAVATAILFVVGIIHALNGIQFPSWRPRVLRGYHLGLG